MIRLNEYIKNLSEDNILNLCENNYNIDDNIIEEGFLSGLLKTFKDIKNALKNIPKNFRQSWVGIAKSAEQTNDEQAKKFITNTNDAMSKSDDKGLKTLKKVLGEFVEHGFECEKTDVAACEAYLGSVSFYKQLCKDKNIEEQEKELIDNFVKKVEEHFGKDTIAKAKKEFKDTQKEIKQEVQDKKEEGEKKEEGNKEELPQAQKGGEAGVNDEGKPVATTGTQVEKNTKEAINDNADFLKPLLEKANIDAKVLQRAVNMFSKSIFKEETGNKNGKKVYSWTKEIQNDIDSSSLPNKASELNKKIIDGLSSVICGLLILEKESLINGVYRLIDPKGNSKESLMKMINTKKFDLEPNK